MYKKTIIFCSLGLVLLVGGVYFYKDATDSQKFRSSHSHSALSRLVDENKRCFGFNDRGLSNVKFSGSMPPSIDQLKSLQETISKLIVVGGLHEDEWFLHGRNLSYYCYGFKDGAVTDQVAHKKRFKKKGFCWTRRALRWVPINVDDVTPSELYTLDEKLKEMGIPHMEPLPPNWIVDWSYVSQLIDLFEMAHSTGTHLHFYCKNGKGRTTTLLALYDIFLNAQSVSLEDIITRHYCMGGEDIQDTRVWKRGTWTGAALENRYRLVKAFHDYMTSPEGYGSQSWENWFQARQGEGYANLPITERGSDVHRFVG